MLLRLWQSFTARFSSGRFSSGQSGPDGLGLQGERLAARFLQKLGYRILARGHRERLGELDLVALDGQTIVLVEVKTWRMGDRGDPSLAVDERKQEKLTRAALTYLKQRRLLEQPARFDVISIVWDGDNGKPVIRHFINAFEAVGKWQMHR
jgi:putative endonuclease